jgi:hypothetical protein
MVRILEKRLPRLESFAFREVLADIREAVPILNADFHGWDSPHNPRVIALAFPRFFMVRHDPV